MPHDGVPIRGNKQGASAGSQDAECLRHNAINVGDVLGNLSAGNNIEGSIGLTYIGRISHGVRQPRWRVPPLAERNEITGNIDAGGGAVATNDLGNAFTQEAGTTTHIQHALPPT